MLKLTDSFYRYFKGIHVKHYSYISCRRCALKNISSQRSFPLLPTLVQVEQLCLLGSKKNKSPIKKPPQNLNSQKMYRPMRDSLYPTENSGSYGGHFNISDTDGSQPLTDQSQNSDTGSGRPQRQQLQIPHNFRVWESVTGRSDKNDGSPFKFKIVSYNVLAQCLLESHPHLYTKCHPDDLKWSVRSDRLYDEIMKQDPDILCLQEVQESHLSTFYYKFMQNGYFRCFKKKTGERQDGCAIFFKQSMFYIVDQISVEYFQPDLPILTRDNIGLMVKLVAKEGPTNPFVVATTHLLYNPKRTDVRLAQVQLLLAEIDRFAYSREYGYHPIILTGDLNSKVNSAVVELLERGNISVSQFRGNSDWQRIEVTDKCQHLAVYLDRQRGYGYTGFSEIKIQNTDHLRSLSGGDSEYVAPSRPFNTEHKELFNTGVVEHSFRFSSVYDKFKHDGEPEATTFQGHWLTVDYIYFSRCAQLSLVERLRLPASSECHSLGRLPNNRYASDHLALGAIFELRVKKYNL